MTLQTIRTLDGSDYVLLPLPVYKRLKPYIQAALQQREGDEEYEPFELEHYIDNPVALARIKAGLTQEELAARMGVTQPYVAKLERQVKATAKTMAKVNQAIRTKRTRQHA